MFGSLLDHIKDNLTGAKDNEGNAAAPAPQERTTAQRIGGGLIAAGRSAQGLPEAPQATQHSGGLIGAIRGNKPASKPEAAAPASSGGEMMGAEGMI